MIRATAEIKPVTPYSQNRYVGVPKKPKETDTDYENRTWMERAHVNQDGSIIIPKMAFKHALVAAAQYSGEQIPGKGKQTYTKNYRGGVAVFEDIELPIKKEDVVAEWVFVPADGKRGGGRRVWKCFPVVPADKWKCELVLYILDETITKDVFVKHLEEAGKYIGVGRFRPQNQGEYGRYGVGKVKWEENVSV